MSDGPNEQYAFWGWAVVAALNFIAVLASIVVGDLGGDGLFGYPRVFLPASIGVVAAWMALQARQNGASST